MCRDNQQAAQMFLLPFGYPANWAFRNAEMQKSLIEILCTIKLCISLLHQISLMMARAYDFPLDLGQYIFINNVIFRIYK